MPNFPYNYVGPQGTVGPASLYVTRTYMEMVRGVENIRRWSRKGGTHTTADGDAIQAAIVASAVQIEARIGRRYKLPLTNSSSRDASVLQWAAERMASYETYIGRGLQEDDPTGNMLKQQRDEALEMMDNYAQSDSGYAFDADEIDEDLRHAPALVV